VSPEQAAGLAAYLDVLRKWNQKSNLTAFELNPPSEAAIDRLIVEPVVASNRLLPADRLLIDIGSGGGSPAIPLRLMATQLRVVLVEARTRKSAFLREVVRQLGLEGTKVENCRFEVKEAETMMRREGIAWLSSTHKSIEEIATTILRDLRPDRLMY